MIEPMCRVQICLILRLESLRDSIKPFRAQGVRARITTRLRPQDAGHIWKRHRIVAKTDRRKTKGHIWKRPMSVVKTADGLVVLAVAGAKCGRGASGTCTGLMEMSKMRQGCNGKPKLRQGCNGRTGNRRGD